MGCENGRLGNYSTINGLQVKGKRDTVKVWLQDGTTICCTPEHKFMLENGEWCRADELKDKYVTCGIDYPEDKIEPLEEYWELELEGCTLHMKDYINREKSLAFARMLGYILTDGSIYMSKEHNRIRKCAEVCFGTLIDAKNFRNDMKLFEDTKYELGKDNIPSRSNQRYLFTYDTHIDKIEYIQWMTKKLNGKPKFMRLAYDNEDEPRTHVIIDFGNVFFNTTENFFDYNDIPCSSKVIYTRGMHKDWQKCIQYYMSMDSDNSDLLISDINTEISIRKKGNSISLPQKLSNMIHSVEDIIIGKRATQPMKLPAFILNENCPLSIVREFLGGLFGGDGAAPYYCSSNRFGYVSFKWTTIEKYKEHMEDTFNSILNLLSRLDVNGVLHLPLKIKYGEKSIKPNDFEEIPRWDYSIGIHEDGTDAFNKNVGFRYCVNKSCRLAIVSSYIKMSNKTKEQCSKVVNRVLNLVKEQDKLNKKALEIARRETFEDEPVINEYSLSSIHQRDGTIKRKGNFPSALEYLNETQTLSWFSSRGYAVKTDDTSIPCFRKKVIDVKQNIPHDVYDIEVDVVHNYLANGISVSNCSLYPSILVAYNIDYSTLVDDPFLASRGIFNTVIPDSKCHVFEWSEHINCRHDELRGKRSKKKVICGNYKHRFLKQEYEKGVVPSIIVDLLSERKKVKREMESIIPEGQESEHLYSCGLFPKNVIENIIGYMYSQDEIKEKEFQKTVLNSRQLAIKVMANSAYGTMGSTKGYLSFIPGAMTVTRIGRMSIQRVQEENRELSVIYGDSISADSPILTRDKNGLIEIKRVEDLTNEWAEYKEFFYGDETRRDRQQGICDKEVWSDYGWTKIQRVIRHKTNKRMYRVNSHGGVVDVTEDHSLLKEDGTIISPRELKVEDILLTSYPEHSEGKALLFSESKEAYHEVSSFTKEEFVRGQKYCHKARSRIEYFSNKLKIEKNPRRIQIYNKKIDYFIKKFEESREEEKEARKTLEILRDKEEVFEISITSEEAYLWGMFMAEGCCGFYGDYKRSFARAHSSTWYICNDDKSLLYKCKDILSRTEKELSFKFYEDKHERFKPTWRLYPVSSRKRGLIPCLVRKYRRLFYDRKYKIIPSIVLNGTIEIRQSFFDGYYDGDGDKGGVCKRFDCKGKLGSSQLYYLSSSLGYKCSVNTRYDKMEIYKITITKGKQRKAGGKVKKIYDLGINEDFVYDLETECSHFMAGVGNIICHNTDSLYCKLEHQPTSIEGYWTEAEKIVAHMKTIFPAPMSLEFENVVHKKFLLLSKKRYAEIQMDRNGKMSELKSKGTILVKRDFALFVQLIYGGVINIFFDGRKLEIPDYLLEQYQKIFTRQYQNEKFIISKSMSKGINDYTSETVPAHVSLAKTMIARGQDVATGSRMRYIFTTEGSISDKQSVKVEDYDFFSDHCEVIRLDYLYYLKSQARQVDDLVSLIFSEELEEAKQEEEKALEEIEGTLEEERIAKTNGVITEKIKEKVRRLQEEIGRKYPKFRLCRSIISSISKNQLKLRLKKQDVICQIKNFRKPKLVFVE